MGNFTTEGGHISLWGINKEITVVVYCVALMIPCEGEDLRGVFSTLFKAQEFAETFTDYNTDDIAIWEFEVDGQFIGHANKEKFNTL